MRPTRDSCDSQYNHGTDTSPRSVAARSNVSTDSAIRSLPSPHRGVPQHPVTGHSFRSALADPAAPATNRIQYFENGGSRALVHDGWKAVCRHEKGADFDPEAWELYRLSEDASECDDLAAAMPDKLAELRYHVLTIAETRQPP